MSASLPLRDVHLPPPPALWPPAPGWWLLAAVLLLLAAIPLWRAWRRRRRRAAWARVFQQELGTAGDELGRLTIAVTLLRRALRERQPDSAQLRDAAWLQAVDPTGQLSPAQQALLGDGVYRRQVDATQVQGLLSWIQRRFVDLLQERRP